MSLTSKQIDALKELLNIGVGHGAGVLNTMLSSHIRLSVPSVKLLAPDAFRAEMATLGDGQLASVDLGFNGIFSGTAELIFSSETASKLVSALVGEEPVGEDLDVIRAGTLCEVGNIVLNGVLGSISNVLHLDLTYTVPNFRESHLEGMWDSSIPSEETPILLARTRFVVAQLDVAGDITLFFEIGALDALLASLDVIIT